MKTLLRVLGGLIIVAALLLAYSFEHPKAGPLVIVVVVGLLLVYSAKDLEKLWVLSKFQKEFGIREWSDTDKLSVQRIVNTILRSRAIFLQRAYKAEKEFTEMSAGMDALGPNAPADTKATALFVLDGTKKQIEKARDDFYGPRDLAVAAGYLTFESYKDYLDNERVTRYLEDDYGIALRNWPSRLVKHLHVEVHEKGRKESTDKRSLARGF